MKLADLLNEGAGDTETIRRLIMSGQIRIPVDPESGMPTPSYPDAWKDFFEGEKDYGVNLDGVDWESIHGEFYV
jgi:hypothetical protein